jgi:hypothetical protein
LKTLKVDTTGRVKRRKADIPSVIAAPQGTSERAVPHPDGHARRVRALPINAIELASPQSTTGKMLHRKGGTRPKIGMGQSRRFAASSGPVSLRS